jgi:hypothetical protein
MECCYPTKVRYGSLERAPVNDHSDVGTNVLSKTKLAVDACPSHNNVKERMRKLVELLTCGYVMKIVMVTNRCVVD